MPNECVHPDLQEIEDFDFVKDCAVPIAPPPILGSPSDLQLDPMPPLPSSGSVIQIGDGEGGGGTISGVITGNVASRATGGSPLDELTGWLYAANDTGLVIETLSSGTRVIATLDAELLQRGVVSPDDQRFLGDKRVVQSDPLGGTGWSVSSFTDVRGDAFPTGYTLKDGDQLRPKSLTGGAILPEGSVYFWAEHRSFGVALKADSGGGGSGLASDWGYVRPLTHPGEAYAGHHTSASAGDKAAEVVHGAGLTQPYSNDVDTSSHTGYYPAFSIYTASRYAEEGSTTARLWIGADVTPSHERIGLTRGYPSDESTGLAEFHFRKQTWEPDVPGVPPSPPTPALAQGDMLISRLHFGIDTASDYPASTRVPTEDWPEEPEGSYQRPWLTNGEADPRYWIQRGDDLASDDAKKLYPGADFDFHSYTAGGIDGDTIYGGSQWVPIVRGGIVIGTVLNEFLKELDRRLRIAEALLENHEGRIAALEP